MPSRSLHAQSAFRTKQATYGTSSDTALSSRTHRILLRTRSAEIVQRTQKRAQDASPFGYALTLSALNVGQCADHRTQFSRGCNFAERFPQHIERANSWYNIATTEHLKLAHRGCERRSAKVDRAG
jgi:hypothetical protein